MTEKVILLTHPENEQLADKLLKAFPEFYEKVEIQWAEFADGTPNLMINNINQLNYRHVLLLTSFRNSSTWMNQIAVIYALPRYLARSVTVSIPFFPTGTMERVDTEGQIATAMTLSRILSATPPTQQGPVKFLIFDIHALQSRFYFRDTILPCLLSAIPCFLDILEKNHHSESIAIAFPDDGAKKRFGCSFSGRYPLILCSKVREGDKRVLKVTEGDPKGKHVFVIDDLVQSGGTLQVCKDVLLEHGAEKVSGFVTHGVFPCDSWKNFVDKGWTKLYITDSVPETVKAVSGVEPFEVISIFGEIHRFMKAFVMTR